MARRFFRKLIPRDEAVRRNRVLRLFGSTLLNKRLWHLNRHSTAWGVASGLFWAWIAAPVQTAGAVSTAILGRGNVALAVAFTWVSNPVTWVPCVLLDYWVGLKLTGAEPIGDLRGQFEQIMGAGLVDGMGLTAKLLSQDIAKLYPVYVGGIVIGAVNAIFGYVVVKLAWRWNIVRRWHRRHEKRRRFKPGLKLTSGFAHLARRAHLTHARPPEGAIDR